MRRNIWKVSLPGLKKEIPSAVSSTRQIYRAVIDLLDKIHDLTGRERISARDYLELVETGLSQISLGTIRSGSIVSS